MLLVPDAERPGQVGHAEALAQQVAARQGPARGVGLDGRLELGEAQRRAGAAERADKLGGLGEQATQHAFVARPVGLDLGRAPRRGPAPACARSRQHPRPCAARVEPGEGSDDTRLRLVGRGHAQAAQAALGEGCEHAPPEQGAADARHAHLDAVEVALAAVAHGGHLDEMADGVLHARAGRRGARDPHRQAAQGERRGDGVERRGSAPRTRGAREQVGAAVAGERDDRRRVEVVHAEDVGEIPVGRRGEGRNEVGEARHVEPRRRA